jgi:hypothetical protein
MKSQPKQLRGCRRAGKSEATDPAVRASSPNLIILCEALWTSMEPQHRRSRSSTPLTKSSSGT